MRMWGLGCLGGHFYFMKRIARKFRWIILLHLGVATFRFHFGKTLKPLVFMIVGFSDVSMTPKTDIIYLWRNQSAENNSRKNPNRFRAISLLQISSFGNRQFWKCRKRRAKIPTIRLISSWKSWAWYQYFPKHMKFMFWNLEDEINGCGELVNLNFLDLET